MASGSSVEAKNALAKVGGGITGASATQAVASASSPKLQAIPSPRIASINRSGRTNSVASSSGGHASIGPRRSTLSVDGHVKKLIDVWDKDKPANIPMPSFPKNVEPSMLVQRYGELKSGEGHSPLGEKKVSGSSGDKTLPPINEALPPPLMLSPPSGTVLGGESSLPVFATGKRNSVSSTSSAKSASAAPAPAPASIKKIGSMQSVSKTAAASAPAAAASAASAGEEEEKSEVPGSSSKVEVISSFPAVGVSLRWLLEFLDTDAKVKKEKDNAKFTGAHLVERFKEVTIKEKQSIADMLAKTKKDAVNDRPEVFICYARKYSVKQIRDCLEKLLDETIPDLFIWMDAVCVNHHLVAQGRFNSEFWTESYYSLIASIGRTVVLTMPWNKPINATRAWCLFEIYATLVNEQAELAIVSTDEELENLRKDIRANPEKVEEMIENIAMENAEASSADERNAIIRESEAYEGGSDAFFRIVRNPFENYILHEATNISTEMEKELVGMKADNKAQSNAIKAMSKVFAFIGTMSGSTGNAEMEEFYTKKAIEIRKQIFSKGEADPQKAFNISQLAESLRDQGKDEEAVEYFKEAIALAKANTAAFGPQHPFVAQNLMHLSGVYLRLERDAEAEKAVREALPIWEKTFGQVHDTYASARETLGTILAKRGNVIGAESAFEEALASYGSIYPPEHPVIDTALGKLAELYYDIKKMDLAEKIYLQILQGRRIRFGDDHPVVGVELYLLASFYMEQNRLEDAEGCYYESLLIRMMVFGPSHPLSKQSYDGLIESIKAQKGKEAVVKQWVEYAKSNGIV